MITLENYKSMKKVLDNLQNEVERQQNEIFYGVCESITKILEGKGIYKGTKVSWCGEVNTFDGIGIDVNKDVIIRMHIFRGKVQYKSYVTLNCIEKFLKEVKIYENK